MRDEYVQHNSSIYFHYKSKHTGKKHQTSLIRPVFCCHFLHNLYNYVQIILIGYILHNLDIDIEVLTVKSITNHIFTADSDIFVKLLLINGPNLNMLGKREPEIYGSTTLDDIVDDLSNDAAAQGITLTHMQSNAEHEIVTRIQDAMGEVDFIIINPGAFTHTSIAIRDALLSISVPFIEVHLSNVHAREAFRHHSYFSDVAYGVICGLGAYGYKAAMQAAKKEFES